jgi:hypothetical protein
MVNGETFKKLLLIANLFILLGFGFTADQSWWSFDSFFPYDLRESSICAVRCGKTKP